MNQKDIRHSISYWVIKLAKIILPPRLIYSQRLFLLLQRLGIHLTPVHFYQPIPDTRKLPESLWQTDSELAGISIDPEAQLDRLEAFASSYRSEYEQFPKEQTSNTRFFHDQDAFKSVDAEILYCMVRYFKPTRFVEVGCGMTTLITLEALKKNKDDTGNECEFIAIEPYPKNFLRQLPEISKFIKQPVQDVAVSEFERLGPDDILFIDSTHVLRIGSDVQYLFLEVLPRLKPGVIVHIHDIFLPQEYPRQWVMENRRFWNEQYLLQAFLACNDCFEILWAGNYMYQNYSQEIESAFPASCEEERLPGSFWIKRVR